MRVCPRYFLAVLIVLMPLLGAPPLAAQDDAASSASRVRAFSVARGDTDAAMHSLQQTPASLQTPTPAADGTPTTPVGPGEYESPTYGYAVSWNEDVWSVDQESTLVASGSAALDQLRLLTGTGPALYVKGARFGDTSAAGCVAAESEFASTNESRSEYGPYLQDDGTELAGEEGDAAFAAFQYVFTPETGSPIDEVLYINCRLLPGGTSLLFVLVSAVSQFEPYLVESADVIDSLVLPAVTLASPTPVADVGEYESPTYGFSVTWDERVWSVDESATMVASGTAALDRIRLVPGNGPALYIEGANYRDADAAACVSAESGRLEADPGRSEYRPYLQPDGAELAGEEGDVAFAAFQYLTTPATGDPYQAVVYIACRLLPGSGASVLFTLFSRLEQFETYLAETDDVISTLQLPAADQATPVTVPTPSPEAIPESALTEAWFTAQVAAATEEPSVAGPLAGELVQDLERVSLALVAANEQDFYLRARFQNPADAEAPWDFGVQFRDRDGQYYRLIVDSAGQWFLRQGTQIALQSGTLTSVVPEAGAVNALELVVVGDTGAFRLNGEEIGDPLDLSALSGPGGVSIGVAFFTGNTIAGAVSNYRDVELWRIAADEPTSAIQTAVAALTTTPTGETPTATPEPTATATPDPTATPEPSPTTPVSPTPTSAAGPATLTPVDMVWFDAQVEAATAGASIVGPVADELEHSADRVSLYLAAVDVADFYLRVELENPVAADEHAWDFGVIFRSLAEGGHYRLTFDSSGRWYLRLGSDQILDTGSVTTLNTGANESNLLELIVAGNTAAFRINGEELVGPIDVSSLSGTGRVLIGAAFSVEGTIEGGVTSFRDLQIWPLEPVARPTASPAAETPGPTATSAPTIEPIPTIPGAPTAEATSSVPLIPTQTAAGRYESPQFGYTLTWDSSWYEFGQVSADVDVLQLANGTATVTVVGSFADGASALGCQESALRVSANLPELSPVLAGGQPLAGGDDTRAWSVYRYRSDSGGVRALYFECRSMPTIEATVLIAMDTAEGDYNQQATRLASLLENLVLP